ENVVFRMWEKAFSHMLQENLGVSFNGYLEQKRECTDALVSDSLIQYHCLSLKEVNFLAPLYLYPNNNASQADAFALQHRTLNLDPKLYAAICKAAGIDPADQVGPDDDFLAAAGETRPSEVKVFDYIYGVLHS